MSPEQFIQQSTPFLNHVVTWVNGLKPVALSELVASRAKHVAVISVDIVNGFCVAGTLASPRATQLVEPIARLLEQAHAAGVRNFVLTQDCHPADSVEFAIYPPHCIRGTAECATVDRFQALPFFKEFQVFPKLSLNSVIGTGFEAWLAAHPEVDTFIAVGNTTDLCAYQLAMHLKLRAVAGGQKVRVIVPANCVNTYDLSVGAAKEYGLVPHDGDFLHTVFLHHMMLNGIEVVSAVV